MSTVISSCWNLYFYCSQGTQQWYFYDFTSNFIIFSKSKSALKCRLWLAETQNVLCSWSFYKLVYFDILYDKYSKQMILSVIADISLSGQRDCFRKKEAVVLSLVIVSLQQVVRLIFTILQTRLAIYWFITYNSLPIHWQLRNIWEKASLLRIFF